MATTYQYKVDKASVDGTCGHHTVLLQIIETSDGQTFQGAVERCGIDARSLISKFGGDVTKWIESEAQKLLDLHQRRRLAHMELLSMSGKVFDLPVNEEKS